jgi:creatinine amidohydrolase
MRPYILAETNLKSVRENPAQLVILPWGATEPHNLHLPYGTDSLTVTRIGELLCQNAWEQGARAYLLPTVPFGVNTNTLAFPLVINMNPSTQLAVLRDIVASLKAAGVRKLLLINGHGGNDFNPHQRELFDSGVFIATCNWWQVCEDAARKTFSEIGDHADEMETSVGLHLFANFVAPLDQADDGRTRVTRFKAFNEGWVKITRPWDKLTTNTGVGNPHKGTADKGRRYIEAVLERLTPFVVEFAKTETDPMFPYIA